ncbi:MAG: hypothetical protein AMQ22_01837 [Candidatus Methanofastidiosum methylothiophilum]|uniref:Uncharacterized protein n=1 Tax=Candidatus Methanofastidiosum methylothiophilum TaxID=1705564 RepID=A0A150IV56_9EURY|nr:MAG: hypothetical protein AMQ22_01837 [Candidatus Methanofastidiosum methylthiophilus]
MNVSHKRTYQVTQYEPLTLEFELTIDDKLGLNVKNLSTIIRYLQIAERVCAAQYMQDMTIDPQELLLQTQENVQLLLNNLTKTQE